jgi:hypothetical protein
MGYYQSANLYDEGGRILMQTSPLATQLPSLLSVNYLPPLIVNTPTTLNFTISPSVSIDSYFVLKFPSNGLNN